MLSKIAIIFGIIMLIVGVLGFVPDAAPHGYLLGLFHINPPHNLIHILTGAISLYCGFSGRKASRIFFQVFGIVYGIVAILGFFYGTSPILGFIANNMADNILHVVIALIALYLGFGCCCRCASKSEDNDKDKDKDTHTSPSR